MPVYSRPEHLWSVDEMANAALLNPYQRDNMAATVHRIAYKTADESVTNSTTVQTDNHLVWDHGPAGSSWYLKLMLMCSQPTVTSLNCDIKVQLTAFFGTLGMSSWCLDSAGGLAYHRWGLSSTQTMDVPGGDGGTSRVVFVIEGLVTGLNSTFKVNWAQNTADTGALVVYKGSSLWGCQVSP
jgi:hypothetical protein